MSLTEEHLKKKATELAREIILLQNDSYIDNEFTSVCMVSNRYGTSFTTEKYKKLQKQWRESFRATTCNVLPIEINGKILTCKLLVEGRHTGEFLGIDATGNNVSIDGTIDLLLVGRSIAFLSNLSNNAGIIGQITKNRSVAQENYLASITRKSLAYRFFTDTISYLDYLGVKVTSRQLQTLCLWITGRSDAEIATIIGVKRRTINSFQMQLRHIFDSPRKYILFEKLLEMDVMHLINQCLFFMVKGFKTHTLDFSKKV